MTVANATTGIAAFFDLDKTIIATSASAALSRPLYDSGLVSRADVIRTAYAHLQYLLGSADASSTERIRKQLADLAKGWDVSKVSSIVADAVVEHVNPYVYPEAVALIAEHHALGHDVVIVTASGQELATPIADLLGADHVIATRMEVSEGRFTGEIDFYAYGDNKALAMRQLAHDQGYDLDLCYAYTDSITDVPMLETVGHGFVVNPGRGLRVLAVERGWDALTFTRAVAVPAVLEKKRSRATAGLMVAGAAAWLTWRLLKKRQG